MNREIALWSLLQRKTADIQNKASHQAMKLKCHMMKLLERVKRATTTRIKYLKRIRLRFCRAYLLQKKFIYKNN